MPRTGATAFEMMVPQNIENFQIYKFGFLTIFFAITILFSLKSSKVVDRVGAILTPILLAVFGQIKLKLILKRVRDFHFHSMELQKLLRMGQQHHSNMDFLMDIRQWILLQQ